MLIKRSLRLKLRPTDSRRRRLPVRRKQNLRPRRLNRWPKRRRLRRKSNIKKKWRKI
jgi:hypothetical protein